MAGAMFLEVSSTYHTGTVPEALLGYRSSKQTLECATKNNTPHAYNNGPYRSLSTLSRPNLTLGGYSPTFDGSSLKHYLSGQHEHPALVDDLDVNWESRFKPCLEALKKYRL
jgi:hypothetical protein